MIDEVDKMLNCRDFAKLGYAVYRCPDCGKVEKIVPFSCKSRFCSSCGKVAVDNWINNALSWFLDVPYHHLVFTIPEELRNVFLYDRSLYNILFCAASRTVLEWCRDNAGYVPGIVCILHSFGSELNHNPHIHMMITDGQSVAFEYHDKASGEHKLVTMPVGQFMARLVRHIPDKHFRQIRYYGLYASRGKRNGLAKVQAILKLVQGKRLEPLNWRQRRKLQRGFDPLICGHCGSELKLVKLVYCSRDGPMTEISFE